MTADDHRCEPVFDADGNMIAVARVSPDISDEGRAALVELIAATTRRFQADCAADPGIGERQAAAVERIRARARRLLGESA